MSTAIDTDNDKAGAQARPEEAQPRHRDSWRAALGLALGALLAVGLGQWLQNQESRAIAEEASQQALIIKAMALVDMISALQSADVEDRAAAAGQLLNDWRSAMLPDSDIRIVQIGGARLLASTFPNDATEKGFPRRLGRDEKTLFDQAKAIKTAVDTNVKEGVFRKRQIVSDTLAGGDQLLTLPYLKDGKVVGMVQLQSRAEPAASALAERSLVFAVLTIAVAFAFALWLLWWLMERPPAWAHFAVAAAALIILIYGVGLTNQATLGAQRLTSASALSDTYGEVYSAYASAAGALRLATTSMVQSAWDVDSYQRPRTVLQAGGAVDQAEIERLTDEAAADQGRNRLLLLLLGIGLLAFFALGYARRFWDTLVEHKHAYGYVSPAMFGMIFLVMFPFAYGIMLSFTETTLFNEQLPLAERWVGFTNYLTILFDFQLFQTGEGGRIWNYENFYWTTFITICWTILNVAVGVIVGMILALALNTENLRGKAIYRVLLILPWAIPNYITALTWKGMFHQQFGVFNQIIQMFGGEPIAWFDGVFTSFLTGWATNSWLSFPFMMVVILGGLQSITADMYEAAKVEGASRWEQFRYITLPSLKPTLIPAIILSVVWTFNMFNVIYLVSEGQPAGANEILITQAYKIAFEKYQYGYAAAYSMVIFLILLAYGTFQNRTSKAYEG